METEQNGRGRFIVAAFLISLCLCYVEPSFAITGNRWLKLKADERIAYVGGVLDTWDDDLALCEKKSEEPWCAHVKLTYEPVILCSQHRPYKEIVEVVEKYLKQHPEDGERSMAGHIWISLYESCHKPQP